MSRIIFNITKTNRSLLFAKHKLSQASTTKSRMSTAIPDTMKAWVFTDTTGGLEKNLQLKHDAQLPTSAKALKNDEVLVKTLATGINPVDYKIAETPILGRLMVKRPASPGLDFSGRVVGLGPSSVKYKQHLEPGMMIIGRLATPRQFGSLGQYVVCSRDGAVPAPKGMSAEDAASIGTAGLSAIQSLQPYVKEGSNVFINGGSGGVGLFGIQMAKTLGCHVTVTCSSANVELCKSVGADKVIDYRTSDLLQELKKSGRKYDLFIDNVNNKQLYWAMKDWTSPNARCVLIATDTTLADIIDILQRLITPSFLGGPGRKFTLFFVRNDPEQLEQIGQWMKEGKVRAVKDEVFAYDDAPQAFARLKSKRARGKILISSE